jgi:ABC-type glycerol-3-phosphate transport system substrate-binding protein
MQGEKIMKKIIALVACLTLALTLTVAAFAADFDKTEEITVISPLAPDLKAWLDAFIIEKV